MNTVTFDFPLDGMTIEVEAGYENDGGQAIIGDIECTLRGHDEQRVDFDPAGMFVQQRCLFDKRLTGKITPLFDDIRNMAFDKAQKDIAERQAYEADMKSDQHKEDRTQPC